MVLLKSPCPRWERAAIIDFYRRCDALLVHGEAQKDQLVAFASVDPARIHVVPHGPTQYRSGNGKDRDRLRARFGAQADDRLGLFFGFLRPEKRLTALVKALAQLPARFRLLVAGAGDASEARAIADQLGVANRIHFENRFIEDDEVADLFVASDWIALPYDAQFTSQSGVLNLAMDQHRPVVVGQSPELERAVRDWGIGTVVADSSIETLAAAIAQLANRRFESRTFDAYLAANSWTENARLTSSVYKTLCR